jgi:hypothetical protein
MLVASCQPNSSQHGEAGSNAADTNWRSSGCLNQSKGKQMIITTASRWTERKWCARSDALGQRYRNRGRAGRGTAIVGITKPITGRILSERPSRSEAVVIESCQSTSIGWSGWKHVFEFHCLFLSVLIPLLPSHTIDTFSVS